MINQVYFWAIVLLSFSYIKLVVTQVTPQYFGCYLNPETPGSASAAGFTFTGPTATSTSALGNCANKGTSPTFFGIDLNSYGTPSGFECWDVADSIVTSGQRTGDSNCTSTSACATNNKQCGKAGTYAVVNRTGYLSKRATAVYTRGVSVPTTATSPTVAPTTARPVTTTPAPTRVPLGGACSAGYGQCASGTICDGASCNIYAGVALQSDNYADVSFYASCLYASGSQNGIYTVSSGGGQQQLYTPIAFVSTAIPRVVASSNQGVYYDQATPDGRRHLYLVDRPSILGALGTQTQEIIFALASYQGFVEFDSAQSEIYTCEYFNGNFVIAQYSNAADVSSVLTPPVALSVTPVRLKTVYNLGSTRCGTIRRSVTDDTLYFSYISGGKTHILQGSTGCTNCSSPTRAFAYVDTVVNDYDVSNNYLFYGTSAGLFKYNITGTSAAVKLFTGAVVGIDAGPANSGAGFMTTTTDVFSFPIEVPTSSFYTNKIRQVTSTCVTPN